MPNSIPPAFVFDPMPPGQTPTPPPPGADLRKPLHISPAPAITSQPVPKDLNDLAFFTVRELGELVRRKKVSSVDLTQMYLARLKKYDPTLHFVVTLTENRALAQAREADKEIAAGKYRGPLHGLPWGAKDLLAVKGYPTTWGAGGFEHQVIDEDATVVQRLDAAGAVLDRQALPGLHRSGRPLVWRPDTQSVEPRTGLQRLLRRPRISHGRRLCRLRDRLGNHRLHLQPRHPLRRRPAFAPPLASSPAPAP